MSTFNSTLGIGDMIYTINSEGFKRPYIIGQVIFSGKDVEYRTHIGTHICYEWELDNIKNNSNRFYFTSKNKRDYALKQLHV